MEKGIDVCEMIATKEACDAVSGQVSTTIAEIFGKIQRLKEKCDEDTIKHWDISPRVYNNTISYNGYMVNLTMSTAFDYDENFIRGMKKMLNADEWYFNFRRSNLYFHFIVKV